MGRCGGGEGEKEMQVCSVRRGQQLSGLCGGQEKGCSGLVAYNELGGEDEDGWQQLDSLLHVRVGICGHHRHNLQ